MPGKQKGEGHTVLRVSAEDRQPTPRESTPGGAAQSVAPRGCKRRRLGPGDELNPTNTSFVSTGSKTLFLKMRTARSCGNRFACGKQWHIVLPQTLQHCCLPTAATPGFRSRRDTSFPGNRTCFAALLQRGWQWEFNPLLLLPVPATFRCRHGRLCFKHHFMQQGSRFRPLALFLNFHLCPGQFSTHAASFLFY